MQNRISVKNLPLIEEIKSPLSPIEIFEVFKDQSISQLLHSSLDIFGMGRYSFIATAPFLIFKSKKDNIEIITSHKKIRYKANPFVILKEFLDRYKLSPEFNEISPLSAGCIGYFSYDMTQFIEKLPEGSVDDLLLPDCILGFYNAIITFDHYKNKLYIVSTGLIEDGSFSANRARDMLDWMVKKIDGAHQISNNIDQSRLDKLHTCIDPVRKNTSNMIKSNFSKQGYLNAVKEAKKYISQGNIYQVNLSQRLFIDSNIEPYLLYKRLIDINPACFGSFLNFGNFKVISNSPERFLKLDGRYIQTRPMKGTRPRGADSLEDEKLRNELMFSDKDKAELLMIVDLERNDLGKVCEYSSVKVKDLRILERYSTVYQTTSLIEGYLHKDKDRLDLLKACFPGGSVTGVPKIRAMEIIDELEPTKRGIYTGSIGYQSFSGDMDLNIVIRTFLIYNSRVYFQVGGGIVADSDPEAEYEETLVKARALINAVTGGVEIKVENRR